MELPYFVLWEARDEKGNWEAAAYGRDCHHRNIGGDAGALGRGCIVPTAVEETTTTEAAETTTTLGDTTTTVGPTTTSIVDEVLPREEISSTTTSTVAEVLPDEVTVVEELPFTGASTVSLSILGLSLLAAGVLALAAGRGTRSEDR